MSEGIERINHLVEKDWALDAEWWDGSGLLRITNRQLSVWFGPRAALITSGYGWPKDRDDMNDKQMVVDAICAVARFFRSPRVIFLPDDIDPWCNADDWIGEGYSIEEVLQRLTKIRVPSRDLVAAIQHDPESWLVNGYVVEELHYP